MAYFDTLPTINFDFNIGTNNEVRKIRDITMNLRFKKSLLDDITLFDFYDIRDGETPEKVSEKFYGTPQYHWVIMLLNERFDVLDDWPMTSVQFERFMETKYGIGNFKQIHHYVDLNGRPVTSTTEYIDPYAIDHKIVCQLTFNSRVITSLIPGAFDEAMTDNPLLIVKSLGVPQDQKIYVDHYLDASTAVLTVEATSTQQTEITLVHMINPIAPNVSTPVTNLEYETYVNESKRRIKILHPKMLQQVVQQFGTIVNG